MDVSTIQKALEGILPPTIFDYFHEIAQQESFAAGEHMHHAGNTSKKLYFILKGIARAYYNKDGKDVSCYFAKEGMFITGIDSFFTQQPSIYDCMALEDTVTFAITFEALEQAYALSPEFNEFGRKYITHAYIDLVERLNAIQFQSSQTRYDFFIQKHPDLMNRIPLGHIASYLGITQETLSRIRAKKE